jgi:hypothetical protein
LRGTPCAGGATPCGPTPQRRPEPPKPNLIGCPTHYQHTQRAERTIRHPPSPRLDVANYRSGQDQDGAKGGVPASSPPRNFSPAFRHPQLSRGHQTGVGARDRAGIRHSQTYAKSRQCLQGPNRGKRIGYPLVAVFQDSPGRARAGQGMTTDNAAIAGQKPADTRALTPRRGQVAPGHPLATETEPVRPCPAHSRHRE